MSDLPPARLSPCHECPWRRVSAPGWLGPFTAEQWRDMAHSDEPIACHTSLPDTLDDFEADDATLQLHDLKSLAGELNGEQPLGDYEPTDDDIWQAPGVVQCAGAAIYRSNVCKSPRDPQVATLPADRDTVFGMGEFVPHHNRES